MSKKTVVTPKDVLTAPDAAPVVEAQAEAPATAFVVPPQSEWTVRGVPVEGNPLAFMITFSMTDQGIAMEAARPVLRAVTSMVRDAADKDLDAWESEWNGSADPLKDTVDRHRQAGFSYRALSQKRDLRRYEVVKDEKGEPVKYKGMVIGRMPEKLRNARNAHFERESRERLKNQLEKVQVDRERLARDSGSEGAIEGLHGGQQITHIDDPRRSASIGVSITRGTNGENVAA